MTSVQLADALEVSARTILRDVDALTEAGLPVVVVQGVRGGIELGFNYRTRLTGLAADEAEALGVILGAGLTALRDLGMSAAGQRAADKLEESLPDGVRARVGEARRAFGSVPDDDAVDPRVPALAAAVRPPHRPNPRPHRAAGHSPRRPADARPHVDGGGRPGGRDARRRGARRSEHLQQDVRRIVRPVATLSSVAYPGSMPRRCAVALLLVLSGCTERSEEGCVDACDDQAASVWANVQLGAPGYEGVAQGEFELNGDLYAFTCAEEGACEVRCLDVCERSTQDVDVLRVDESEGRVRGVGVELPYIRGEDSSCRGLQTLVLRVQIGEVAFVPIELPRSPPPEMGACGPVDGAVGVSTFLQPE